MNLLICTWYTLYHFLLLQFLEFSGLVIRYETTLGSWKLKSFRFGLVLCLWKSSHWLILNRECYYTLIIYLYHNYLVTACDENYTPKSDVILQNWLDIICNFFCLKMFKLHNPEIFLVCVCGWWGILNIVRCKKNCVISFLFKVKWKGEIFFHWSKISILSCEPHRIT